MKRNKEANSIIEICPVRNVVARFGDKWSLLVLLVIDGERVVRFNELMSERKAYTDPGISIRSIAEELHTNRTYLSQAINRTFGKSFPQVLAEYRVRAAIEMISDPECDMPLKAIAADVGFSSSSVFFTTFRNIVGMTPAVYRKGQTQIGSDCEGEEL